MKVLVCENKSSGTSSTFMVTDCPGKIFTGINVADSVSEEIVNKEQTLLISDRFSGENTLNKWLKNKILLKLAPSPKNGNNFHIWKSL